MGNPFSRRSRLPRPPVIGEYEIIFVRTGEYNALTGELTAQGVIQAEETANRIATIMNGAPLKIVTPDSVQIMTRRDCYYQMAKATALKTTRPTFPIEPLVFSMLIPSGNDVGTEFWDHAFLARLRHEKRYFAYFTDGSQIARLLNGIDGPPVEVDILGPPHGSIHRLVTKVDIKTRLVVERRFI